MAMAQTGHTRITNGTAQLNQLGSDIDGEAQHLSGMAFLQRWQRPSIGASPTMAMAQIRAGAHLQMERLQLNQLGSDIDGESANDNSGYSPAMAASLPSVPQQRWQWPGITIRAPTNGRLQLEPTR